MRVPAHHSFLSGYGACRVVDSLGLEAFGGCCPGKEPHEPEAESNHCGNNENADRHGLRPATLMKNVEEDGRDDGRPDCRGELLHRTQRAAGTSGLLAGDVAEGDLENCAEAGPHSEADDEE